MLPSLPLESFADEEDQNENDDRENEEQSSAPIVGEDVEAILQRQDEALELLLRLRREEPFRPPRAAGENVSVSGKGRRDFRRWPMPLSLSVERHDGTTWNALPCLDIGVGGVRIATDPHHDADDDGPFPMRLRLREPDVATPQPNTNVIVLGDVMWRRGTGSEGQAGVRFEFLDNEERDYWNDALIDALLAAQALQ